MSEKLLNCPFCGNKEEKSDLQGVRVVELEKRTGAFGLPAEPHKIYYVCCGRCFARGGNGVSGTRAGVTITDKQARQYAIDFWNRRAGIDPD